MIHIDLFSGIGGFAIATEMVWEDVEHVFVDNDSFCQVILKKHWPNSTIYGDIKQFITDTRRKYGEQRSNGSDRQKTKWTSSSDKTERPFILTGGFPCQPFSQAGRRKGTADNRYLWPEMFTVIRNTKPTWVIAENVSGLITWNEGLVLETVCADLESESYEVQTFIIPAISKGAPHRRDRVWIVATNAKSQQTYTTKQGRLHTKSGSKGWNQDWPEVATRLCTVDDGLPNGLPRPRGWRNAALKAAGNAIVPQVAAEIMIAIKDSP